MPSSYDEIFDPEADQDSMSDADSFVIPGDCTDKYLEFGIGYGRDKNRPAVISAAVIHSPTLTGRAGQQNSVDQETPV